MIKEIWFECKAVFCVTALLLFMFFLMFITMIVRFFVAIAACVNCFALWSIGDSCSWKDSVSDIIEMIRNEKDL